MPTWGRSVEKLFGRDCTLFFFFILRKIGRCQNIDSENRAFAIPLYAVKQTPRYCGEKPPLRRGRGDDKMGKSKSAIEAPRSTYFNVDPDKLFVATDPKHPLYHVRVTWPLKETTIKSIMAKGVMEPIFVRKNGKILEVTDGRRRVLHAREANKRLVAMGSAPLRVPVIIKNESDKEAYKTGVILNGHREEETVSTRAEHANRLRGYGYSDDEIADDLGVTKKSVLNWKRLKELSEAVRKAIDDGDISAFVAVEHLADLPRGEQEDAMKKLIATGPRKLHGRGEKGGGGAPQKESAISRLRLLYRHEEAMGSLSKREELLLKWFFSEASTGDLLTVHPRLTDFVEGMTKKPKEPKAPKAAKAEKADKPRAKKAA